MVVIHDSSVSRMRYFFVLFIFAIIAVALLARAIYLQHYRHETLRHEADSRHLRNVPISAHRGIITDREGQPLAISASVYAVWVDPVSFDFDSGAINQLADVLDLDVDILRARIERKKERNFVYIKRHANPIIGDKVRDLELPGVGLSREYQRFYPMGEATAHLIGATDIDDVGIEGIEKQFDEIFRGIPGERRVLRDLYGHTVENVELVSAPKKGKRLALTIDRNIQYRAYRALKAAVKKHKARGGSAVLMDAQSGEVLALVNQPSFNPNTRQSAPRDRRNSVLIDEFEPGSTIKPFIVASLLDGGYASIDMEIETAPGYYEVSGKQIVDHSNYGRLSLSEIIVKSSNVGISKVAMMIPAEQLWQTFRKLGAGQILGTGFPGEARGKLMNHVDWSTVDQAVMSYGYGVSVSLLQLAYAYSVFANDGWQPPLSLVKGRQVSQRNQVFSAETARTVRQTLEQVVSGEGTGKRAKINGFSTAGKTGTTHKNKAGSYLEEEYISLFVGFAPASRPRLIAAVMIDTPTAGEYFGGVVAAPVFSEIMQDALRRFGIPGDESISPKHKQVRYTLGR